MKEIRLLGIGLLVVLSSVLATPAVAAPAVASSPPEETEGNAVTEAGLLPSRLEHDLDEVNTKLAQVSSEHGFAADLNAALEHWFGAVSVAKERWETEKTPAAQEAFLRVLEEAVGDVQKRLTAVAPAAARVIAGYQDAYRQLESVRASLDADQRKLTDGQEAGEAARGKLEGRARELVMTFLKGDKKGQQAKREIRRIKIQLAMLPLREEMLRVRSGMLQRLGGQLAQYSEHARQMEDHVDASVVAFEEMGGVYGEVKETIQLYRTVTKAAGQIASSDYVTKMLTNLSTLQDRQVGFLEALKAATNVGADLQKFEDTMASQKKAASEVFKRFGGDDIQDMVNKYGPAATVSKAE